MQTQPYFNVWDKDAKKVKWNENVVHLRLEPQDDAGIKYCRLMMVDLDGDRAGGWWLMRLAFWKKKCELYGDRPEILAALVDSGLVSEPADLYRLDLGEDCDQDD